MTISRQITDKFEALYKTKPVLVRAPGRINLIGEHTDYNHGFVLPAAIDKEMTIAAAPNGTNTVRVYSIDYEDDFEYELTDYKPLANGWPNYIMGVTDQFQKAGHQLKGFDCVFGGDIPIGAGLSSSAALECGIAFAIKEMHQFDIDKLQLVQFAQKAEHTFAGVQCGIMDQFASVMGKQDHAIRLDCRSLSYEYFPIDLGEYQILLLDTQVKHDLASSAYNERKQECETGVNTIQKGYPEIKSLRDVNFEMLIEFKEQLSDKVYQRCLYIIEENNRLLSACAALQKGDIQQLGKMLYGSHQGLSEQYEVSCAELDFLVDFTKDKAYVLGARMMGGGFGGCTINVVEKKHINDFIEAVSEAYNNKYQITLKTYEVAIKDGTGLLSSETTQAN